MATMFEDIMEVTHVGECFTCDELVERLRPDLTSNYERTVYRTQVSAVLHNKKKWGIFEVVKQERSYGKLVNTWQRLR